MKHIARRPTSETIKKAINPEGKPMPILDYIKKMNSLYSNYDESEDPRSHGCRARCRRRSFWSPSNTSASFDKSPSTHSSTPAEISGSGVGPALVKTEARNSGSRARDPG